VGGLPQLFQDVYDTPADESWTIESCLSPWPMALLTHGCLAAKLLPETRARSLESAIDRSCLIGPTSLFRWAVLTGITSLARSCPVA
jgi:hypothetical protein